MTMNVSILVCDDLDYEATVEHAQLMSRFGVHILVFPECCIDDAKRIAALHTTGICRL